MSFLEDLSAQEVWRTLERVAEENLRISLTVRYQSRWVTLQTRVIAEHEGVFWIQLPKTDHLPTPHEFHAGERLGLTFVLDHRKYVFGAVVLGREKYRIDDDVLTALRLEGDAEMRRVERRLHSRIELGGGKVTRASFWLGGVVGNRDASDGPVWSGRILNASTGGMLVRTSYEAARFLETGDIIGMHLVVGDDADAIVDGQVRHIERDGEMALLGLQFVEISEALEGSDVVEAIEALVADSDRTHEPSR